MVLTAWGKLDTEMGVVFGSFLNTQAHIGVAVYNQLTNLNTQEAALRAVAKLVLDKDQMDLFLALLKLARGPRDQRNEMAHGVWGFSEDVPDALVLFSPKAALKVRGEVVSVSEQIKMHKNHGTPLPPTLFDRLLVAGAMDDDMWVYRLPDLEEIHKQVEEAGETWRDFARFIWVETHDLAEEARLRLFGHSAIRQAIDRFRADRGEPPLPPL